MLEYIFLVPRHSLAEIFTVACFYSNLVPRTERRKEPGYVVNVYVNKMQVYIYILLTTY